MKAQVRRRKGILVASRFAYYYSGINSQRIEESGECKTRIMHSTLGSVAFPLRLKVIFRRVSVEILNIFHGSANRSVPRTTRFLGPKVELKGQGR